MSAVLTFALLNGAFRLLNAQRASYRIGTRLLDSRWLGRMPLHRETGCFDAVTYAASHTRRAAEVPWPVRLSAAVASYAVRPTRPTRGGTLNQSWLPLQRMRRGPRGVQGQQMRAVRKRRLDIDSKVVAHGTTT